MISFFVPCLPCAQPRQRHRVVMAKGRAFATNYTPAKHKVNEFKATIRIATEKFFPTEYNPGPLMKGPICVRLTFLFPRPGRLIWKTKPMPRLWHTSKPDVENICKACLDALTGCVFADDSQVCALHATKQYCAEGERPGVEVNVEEIGRE